MRRFWVEEGKQVGETVTMGESESRHVVRVLRMQTGDHVELVDGSGMIYVAELTGLGTLVEARVKDIQDGRQAEGARLTVAQAWLKGQKMETVIQKCTELGVYRFQPFWASRCQGKLKDVQGAKKLARYQRIVEAACKQCYRPDLMMVDEPVSVTGLLEGFPAGDAPMRLLFWEEEQEMTLHDLHLPADTREVVIALGPEGGLCMEEAESFRARGWRTVSLGRRILRAETANLTAVSLMQFFMKNI